MNKTSTQKKFKSSVNNSKKENLGNVVPTSCQPGENVINNILNYSKALSIRKSETMEHFEMLLN